MLAKFACITRAHMERVEHLLTRSMIPIRNFRIMLSKSCWEQILLQLFQIPLPYRILYNCRKYVLCQLMGIDFLVFSHSANRLQEISDGNLVENKLLHAGPHERQDLSLRLC